MEKKKDKFNDYFKERLYDHSVPPPENSWQTIDNELKKKRMRVKWIVAVSMAASIALIISTGIGFYLGSQYKTKLVEKQSIQYAKGPDTNNSVKNHPDNNGIAKNEVNSRNVKKDNSNNRSYKTPQQMPFFANSENLNDTEINNGIIKPNDTVYSNGSTETKLTALKQKSIVLQTKSYNNNLAMSQAYCDAVLGIDNAEEKTTEVNNEHNWKVGGNAAPLYTYRNISENSSSSSTDAYNDKEKALLAYSAGLTMNYEKSRWKFETGVYYTKMGQQIDGVYALEKANSTYMQSYGNSDYLKLNEPQSEKTVYSVATGNNIAINNSNGIIVQNNTEAAFADKDYISNLNTLRYANVIAPGEEIATSKVKQQYSYIEIPLIAHYKLVDKRVDMSLTGGMSANILIGNNVYLEKNDDKTKYGETSNIEPINYAGVVGFTFEVPLATRWDFVFEPRFRYYLNSLNKSDQISTHPYSLGVHSGITFTF